MRKYIKNIVTYLVVVALSVGTINLLPTTCTLAAEVDGDVIENPWQDLFNPTHENSDLPTSGVQNDDKVENPTGETNTSTTADKEAVKNLKKQLKVKIVSATKKTKKSKIAKVDVKKVKKAVSYQVKYSTSRKFKKSKTKTKTFKKRKMTLKKLKAGKKYYIKVRAVGKLNGKKVFGSWSKRKVIKVKKK